jgi:hypothetical protein
MALVSSDLYTTCWEIPGRLPEELSCLRCVPPLSFKFEKRGVAHALPCKRGKICVDKKNQLDVTFCILYFSSNSFGQHVPGNHVPIIRS